MVMRAPTAEAVDFYLSSGNPKAGERVWEAAEIPADAAPFRPIAMRLLDKKGSVVDTVRSTEQFSIEVEYSLSSPLTGLRIGVYLSTTRGEYVFSSFDTDDAVRFEETGSRPAGRYVSRCQVPADLLNNGYFILSINASSYRIRRYFHDDSALTFTVNADGAPGSQWAEPRLGLVRPRFDWTIDKVD
jgi:lipopolysaccharide transport system ATP-binding protein